MKTLRTAVIGLGRIGWQFHVPQVLEHEGFDLVAVVDPLQERLDEARSAFGVDGFPSCDALWKSVGLDLVVIASPTPFHARQAIAAFEHGCDVFCDKPMAPSLSEADRMIAAMEKHGRKLMLYQPHRAGTDAVSLQAILRQGLIGPVYMIKRANSAYARRNDWQAFRKHGGGMLNNYGAHFIDQLLYLSGSRAKRVTCSMRTIASLGDAEDVVKVVIETENGTILDLDINQATAHPIPPWQVLGARGSIVLDEAQQAWQARFYREEDLANVAVQAGFAAEARRYGSGEIIPWQKASFALADAQAIGYYQKCYEYFGLDQEPYVPVAQTREVMRVLDACRESARE